MSISRHAGRLGIVAAVVALAACSGPASMEEMDPAAAPPPADGEPGDDWVQTGGPVVLLRTPFLGDAAFTLALEQGWFEEAGIDVETVDANSPAEVFGSIVAGDIDVAYFAPNGALFAAVEQDAPVRIVASASVLDRAGCDYLSIVGTPDAAERIASGEVERLRGLRIAGSFRSITADRFLSAALTSWGTSADAELIEVVTADNTDLAALMAAGTIDLAVVYEPFATTLRDGVGAVPVLGAPEVIPNELTSLYLFSGRLLEDRELGARILAVLLRGEAAYREGPTDRNVAIVSAQTGIEPDLLRRMCWATFDTDGRRYEGVVEDAQATALARGDIDTIVPAERLWDHGFRDRALELLGRP
jgi:NitT/TauT family transport system substrate-binding protein